MIDNGMKTPNSIYHIQIPESKDIFNSAMTYFLEMEGKKYQELPEYTEVISWLSDNECRGLFMYGNCGRGKSLIARYVIPAIFLNCCRKIVAVYDMNDVNANIDEVLKKKIITIDDIGTETESVKYGERRMAFAEIMDAAEKHGKLLIMTTNLNSEMLKSRYGDRTMDRINSVTKRVMFKGNSLRL